MNEPRYRQLAAELRAGIEAGHIPVGERLPTEYALMTEHKVSRHTVREALRLLTETGLITRRQGAGSVVIATEPPTLFTQKIGKRADLLQYARTARMDILSAEVIKADAALAARMRLEEGASYMRFSGLRLEGAAPPIALTQIHVPEALAPRVEDLPDRPGSITEWVAREKKVATDRIEQAIAAHILDPEQAAMLNSEPGAAALMTRRFYYDADGGLVAASESIHPGDRFAYSMTLKREN